MLSTAAVKSPIESLSFSLWTKDFVKTGDANYRIWDDPIRRVLRIPGVPRQG
jgi:hypothetical protein